MPPSLRLILVRHGETEWTDLGLLHGRLDSPLSPAGRRHAGQAADSLAGQRFDAAYSSPRGRALETAAILCRPLGLTPWPLDGLAEADYGWMEGRSLRHWDPDPGHKRQTIRSRLARLAIGVTGEPFASFSRRVAAALVKMQADHPDGRLLIITHWGVLSLTMAMLLDGDARLRRKYGPWAACGISELCSNGAGWEAVRLNDKSHLAKERRE